MSLHNIHPFFWRLNWAHVIKSKIFTTYEHNTRYILQYASIFSVNSHMQNITQTENYSFHDVSPYTIMAVSNEASSSLLLTDVHAQDDGAHQF